MDRSFYAALENCPVIAAVKDEEGLKICLESDIIVVFVLFGDICSIGDITRRIKNAGKIAMVHMDLIGGLSAKEIAVDYLKNYTMADGVISTKQNIIKRAKELMMYTVLRVFLIDSMALSSIENHQNLIKADFIEVLPGVMPRVIKKICKITSKPIIAGGLISDKMDVIEALEAGAMSISTTNQEVWFM
ncbi:glycerol-3-phosphate responsive antiterminator [Anaerosacchariphilus polymeriproducens]|uniref:Glycerol-3-phosphate responsive antiterminator n=1 Tax=Anaerosacchariphilus polymeriproducens TaxID=1812858 RepID=A0A371AY32_9FIRM|nr:glycerol-3-phosphate responsive antiterminator [Anaerosacchariphilus polymeriproducens]RDU24412.1 glycerol-3-phosphate responsive antiterminator [Anaerosacchariphilus polymeriproducens]